MTQAWNSVVQRLERLERGEHMGESACAEFACAVSELKQRSGLSYGALAKQLHFSPSTVYRYCSGAAVPATYAPVERFARACGAEPRELVELHRLWLLADAERHRKPSCGPSAAAEVGQHRSAPECSEPGADSERLSDGSSTGPMVGDADTAVDEAGMRAGAAPAERPAKEIPQGAGHPVRWWRRYVRRPAVMALCVVAFGTVGLLGVGFWFGDRSDQREAGGPTAVEGRQEPGREAEPPPPGPPQEPPPDDAETSAPNEQGEMDGEESGSQDPHAGTGPEAQPGQVPLDWTVRSHVWQQCSHPYLVDREPDQVPRAPIQQDAESWADEVGAVHGGFTVIEATLQAAEGAPVVVDAVHVRVDGRAEPLQWNVYTTSAACGGALRRARFEVDLDSEQPMLVPVDGHDDAADEVLPVPQLPYQVSADDPLLLRVEAETADCDCTWRLEVEWSSGQERGTTVIDDEGEPFRTSGASGGDSYTSFGDDWRPDQL